MKMMCHGSLLCISIPFCLVQFVYQVIIQYVERRVIKILLLFLLNSRLYCHFKPLITFDLNKFNIVIIGVNSRFLSSFCPCCLLLANNICFCT